MTLVGRTAAVTGSFGAIGSAVSKALTELGAHVVAIDVADTASSSTNYRITPLHLDLSDANAIKDWAFAIAQRSTMRKARVALARRLAIIMHAMLRDGTEFASA
jgi:NAD(P)-dependent dehydrogenase (short-subunit alcohol dehydrogenase family)